MARKAKHYVNNKSLYEAMVVYKKDVDLAKKGERTLPIIPDYIGLCLQLICDRLSFKPGSHVVADSMPNPCSHSG